MPYREVIKNFELVRSMLREFYVYGINRDSDDVRIQGRSKRSESDERHRIESWLGDYLGSHWDEKGKSYFLSIDSRSGEHNPLFRAWKTSSFTDMDITMHFILMDILNDPDVELPFTEIVEQVSMRLECDESSIRKKLKEYVEEGIVNKSKRGKVAYYSRAGLSIDDLTDAVGEDGLQDFLDFFAETAGCGVIGSYILDKLPAKREPLFSHKHHYITQTVDSSVVLELMDCVRNKRSVQITRYRRKMGDKTDAVLVPLKLFCSSTTGRQYMMCFNENSGYIEPLRVDYVMDIKAGDICGRYDEYLKILEDMETGIWGISTGNSGVKSHVSFTVEYASDEKYILHRMQREKRIGTVTIIDDSHARFDADLYSPEEIIPWLRTFICRITAVDFEDKKLEEKFVTDLKQMEEMYGL